MNGLLLVDKPVKLTSHDVVDRIRKASGLKRVGHTGTLDPGATGLLVLCLGKATRLSEHLTGLDKTYEGIMRLGLVTDSYDLDGKVLEEHPVPATTAEALQHLCDAFTGTIDQAPPMVSAVKVGGERLYKIARKGEVVERKPRKVSVHEFSVLSYAPPDAQVRVCCSSGTYVRALCHDVGRQLSCGAILASLRRIYVGRYSVNDALPVDGFTSPEIVQKRLIPMEEALDLPVIVVRNASRNTVMTGGTLLGPELTTLCAAREGWVQVKAGDGALLALATIDTTAAGPRFHCKRVLV
ncbi:MAG TPA: tRNA pseudouridine(55) synthase TruB [Candidatus Hydrogenedentes bacterium]|nr:tRNA pseudouridine(55) synthase TruB [Candidatus Hydrogenedentota bacterium]